MGQIVAGDRDSYQYLVESIRKFPDQESFAAMIRAGGLRAGEVSQPDDGCRGAAFGLEDLGARAAQHLAAGPHRRDAGADRRDGCGAGGVRRPAAPAAGRAGTGLAVQVAGPEGRPGAAARNPRADRAGPGLYQVRADPVDPPRRGGRRAGRSAEVPAGQAAALSDRDRQADDRGGTAGARRSGLSASSPSRSPPPRSRRSTEREAGRDGRGRGGQGAASRNRARLSQATSTPSTLPRG